MNCEDTTGNVRVTELTYTWRCNALRLRLNAAHFELVLTQFFLINASEVITVSCGFKGAHVVPSNTFKTDSNIQIYIFKCKSAPHRS